MGSSTGTLPAPHPFCLKDTANGWHLPAPQDGRQTSPDSTGARSIWSQGDGAVGAPHLSLCPHSTRWHRGLMPPLGPEGIWHARHLLPLHLADDLWLDGGPACPGQRQKQPLLHCQDSSTGSSLPTAGFAWTRGCISLLRGWSNTATGFLERWSMPQA